MLCLGYEVATTKASVDTYDLIPSLNHASMNYLAFKQQLGSATDDDN